jgi:polysaccharide pyruvyl transferase WcaK-like protein
VCALWDDCAGAATCLELVDGDSWYGIAEDDFLESVKKSQSASGAQMDRSKLGIALFTPFWGVGANLGDAVILRAVTQCFLQQDPGIEFAAITLDPESVRRSHDLSGMEMLGGNVYFFNWFTAEGPYPGQRLELLRTIYRRLRSSLRFSIAEMRHAVRAMRLLRRVRLLVIAGGGQLGEEWGGAWGLPYAEFKWTLMARLVGCRVAYVSVGVCKLESQLGKWFIRRALARAFFVSVRDAWSARYVEETMGCHAVRLVPDTAFGLIPDVTFAAPSSGSALKIGLSPIAYGRAGVWPVADSKNADPYLATLIAFARNLLASGHSIVLFSTDSPDRPLVDEMRAALLTGAPDGWHQRLSVEAPDTAGEILAILGPLDMVIASRLHGVILSHLMCRPVVAISYDRKVRAHMSEAGYSRFCVDLPALSVAALALLFEALQAERTSVHEDLRIQTAKWRATLAEQYSTVVTAVQLPQASSAADTVP